MADRQTWALYNAIDAAATFKVWNEIKSDMEEFQGQHDRTVALYEPLIYMTQRGIKIDVDELARTKIEVEEKILELQIELDKLCGEHLNVSSPKQCKEYFYIKLGHPPYRNRKTQSITTDDKAMARLARKGVKEARYVQEIRGLRKFYGTYLGMDFDKDNRIRCSWNPRGTVTGRLSSSQTIFGTGGNLMNLDPRFKNFIVCDPDMLFFQFDKRQAEWVATAYISGDARMISVIEQGKDPHTATGSFISGASEKLVDLEHKFVGHASDAETIRELRKENFTHDAFDGIWLPRVMSIRQCGKKSNHGLNYDEGYKTFALINEMEEKEAKRIVEGYHEVYPGLRQVYYKRVQNELRESRTLTNCFGDIRRFMDRWGDQLFKSAYAHNPQSTVARIINDAIIAIWNDNSPEMHNIDLLAQIHDSIEGQYPLKNFRQMAKAFIKCKS